MVSGDSFDNYSPSCVVLDYDSAILSSDSKIDQTDSEFELSWLESTLEQIDYRDHILLLNRAKAKNDSGSQTKISRADSDGLPPNRNPDSESKSISDHFRLYVSKLKSVPKFGPPRRQTALDVFWTFVVSFCVCLFLTSLDFFVVAPTRFVLMIPSFAVIAALIFDNFTAPLAQPRNIIFGNLLGAFIACLFIRVFELRNRWYLTPLAVSLVAAAQTLTGNVHPPGGSIALYIFYGPQKVRDLGFLYLLVPVFIGSLFFVSAATLVLNLFPKRLYPKYWW